MKPSITNPDVPASSRRGAGRPLQRLYGRPKLLFMGLLLPALGLNLHETGLPIGSSLPRADVLIKDVSGKAISLAQVKESGGLLVMFSCNTCPYVIRNQGRTKAVCTYATD